MSMSKQRNENDRCQQEAAGNDRCQQEAAGTEEMRRKPGAFLFLFMTRSVQCIFPPCGGHGLCKLFFRHAADMGRSGAEGGAADSTL